MESTNNTTPLVDAPLVDAPSSINSKKNISNLPSKFQKYLTFAFFFSNILKDNNLLLDDNFDNAISLFKAFDNYDSQFQFFNLFDSQFKSLFKSFKSFLKEREQEKLPKKSRKNKTKVVVDSSSENNVIAPNEETPEVKTKKTKNATTLIFKHFSGPQ